MQEQGFYAKKACGARDLPGALRHSSDMLRELRTSLLTPRNYYELYMKVCDELRHLDQFFQQLMWTAHPQQTSMKEPRLVGMCYRDCIC